MKKTHLLVIDPQRDFCDPDGALAVAGGTADMERLAGFLDRNGDRIWDVHVTLDTHHFFDISHPVFWVNGAGDHPDPFTIITRGEVEDGRWRTTNPQFQKYAGDYVRKLEENNRYPLCVWPPHCLIGARGHNVAPALADALLRWERKQIGMVDYVTKGSNYRTEHYSAVQADVPDPADPTTMLNTGLIQTLEEADTLVLAGEALSHCLKFTVEDIANTFDADQVRKMVLLTDCASPVAGFEDEGSAFVQAMIDRGMQTATTADLAL